MVNSRTYILPSASVSPHRFLPIVTYKRLQSPEFRLRCRLYSTSCHRPRQVEMLTRCADASHGSPHFPMAEALLQEAALQPYIHNCQVTVVEGRHTYQYCVFFKRHCRLPANRLLNNIHEFRGDVAIMRIGAQTRVVNMRGRDSVIADDIITRSVRLAEVSRSN